MDKYNVKGYYVNDKKDGFGIYFWVNPIRLYIGFWKDGYQEGIGKYITNKKNKFGLWKNGTRVKWFNSERDAMSNLTDDQIKFEHLFANNFDSINEFLNK